MNLLGGGPAKTPDSDARIPTLRTRRGYRILVRACFVPMIGMLPLVAFNRRKTDNPRCPLLAQSGHP